MCHCVISDCLHRRQRLDVDLFFQHNGVIISLKRAKKPKQDKTPMASPMDSSCDTESAESNVLFTLLTFFSRGWFKVGTRVYSENHHSNIWPLDAVQHPSW